MACESKTDCTCTASCPNHGKCCLCVASHRSNGEVPGCFFSKSGEASYDRSIENLYSNQKNNR